MSLSIAGLDRVTTEALGWTLVHFLWQGALIAAALCALDVLFAKSRAALRYLLACVAFVMMLVVPMGTFVFVKSDLNGPPARTAAVSPIVTEQWQRVSSRTAVASPTASTTRSARATSMSLPSFSRFLPWVVQLWTVGVVLLSLRLIGGWWLVRRLARSSANVTLEGWQVRLTELARRMRVSQPVRLCRSALVEVPTAVGWLRPMILLPASTLTGLTPAQIEAILAHELAHIRRHDYIVNLLQNVVEMLLFYHPAVWWVSRRIREERELCCDDLAIQVSGDPVSYARALCELERLRGETMDLAMAASGGSLAARIARLLGLPGRPWEAATRGLVGVFGASAVLILLALGGVEESAGKVIAVTRAIQAEAVARISPPVAPTAPEPGEAPSPVTAPEPGTAVQPASAAQPVIALLPATVQFAVDAAMMAPAMAPMLSVSPLMKLRPIAHLSDVASMMQPTPDTPDEESPADAAARRFDEREWERMRQHGISEEYVQRIEAHLPGLSADELIRLANHGVSSTYVANLRKAGLEEVSVDELVRMASHGVSSKYVTNVRNAGLEDVSPEDLVRLADHGVSSAFIRGLRGIDPDDMSVDDLIRLASNGVTSEWYSAMQWMGLSEFSVEQAIQLRNAGITAEYANRLRLVTRRKLSLDELKKLRNHGVSSDYAARMYVLFGQELDVDKLVKLQNHGVSSEYAQQMMVAYRGKLDLDELIELRNQGVEPRYVYEMGSLGRLAPRDLIRLRQQGVSAEFLDQARKAGHDDLSVDEVIELSQKGLPCKTED